MPLPSYSPSLMDRLPLSVRRKLSVASIAVAATGVPTSKTGGCLALLGPKAVADLRACRRRLCEEAAELWLDINSTKLALRHKVWGWCEYIV